MTKLKCYDCGGPMESKVLSTHPEVGRAGVVIFEEVPCEECPRCGRLYFKSEVTRLMDGVLNGEVQASGKAECLVHTFRGTAA